MTIAEAFGLFAVGFGGLLTYLKFGRRKKRGNALVDAVNEPEPEHTAGATLKPVAIAPGQPAADPVNVDEPAMRQAAPMSMPPGEFLG